MNYIFAIILLVCFQKSVSELSEYPSGNWRTDIRTTNVGRVKYEKGEVNLFQNQEKPTNFFFTPFPLVNPSNSRCHTNILSGYVELSFAVELYTSQLTEAVNNYLKEHFSTLCNSNKTCHISMLPMNVIGLIQKGLRANKIEEMYKINQEWFPNTVFLQSINFPIYTKNQSICEHLLSSLVDDCYLSNFEIHYSLQLEKLVERQIDITTEQITSTAIFNRVRSQFSMSDTIVITNDDYKQLLNEIIDKINMKLRIQEGFGSSIQDSTVIERLLDQQLSFKQVHLNKTDDKLWNSLYWKHDFTRPDRLAKMISTIIYRNSTNAHSFLYNHQAISKNNHKVGLTQHDIDRIEELDKLLTTRPTHQGEYYEDEQLDNDISSINAIVEESEFHHNISYILSRADVIKYLSKLSNDIHLEGEIIVPKPIDVHLIKMNSMKVERKLFTHSALIRTRSDIHVLPLQCPLNEKMKTNTMTDRYRWLESRATNLTTSNQQLTNQSSECHREREQLLKRIATLEQTTLKEPNKLQTMSKWKPSGITVAGGHGGGNQTNQLFYPCGFFLDVNENLIITDYWNNRIVKWDYNTTYGEVIAGGNERGKNHDQLNSPRDVIDERQYNSFIICDRDNRRVVRWFHNSKEHQQILMDDIDCWGLAMDISGSIYVSDWKSNVVKRWRQGESDMTIVAGGNDAGDRYDQLNYPTYIFVDEEYSIYIADSDNHRVMKWRSNAKEGVVVAGGNGKGNSLNQLVNPRGIVVDHLDQIYIADMRNHRIMRWQEGEKEGSIVVGGYGQGHESYQLHHPTALAFDYEENLYVADWENHRIQKYEQNLSEGVGIVEEI
ncbi:unnamed protein product [Adineta steineri]|uniref:Uncharacterized protein n=4 Tax=Adineta steineri TaxID=433720 RepID=A0A813SIS6_9BILA|nr:unnamed protein product [Adineta steineri]